MKKLNLLLIIPLFSSLFLSACNTVSGVGRDVSAVGTTTGATLEKASDATAAKIKKITKPSTNK